LPAIAEQALNKLPIPKRMRWGASEAQFVRPVHWLVFLHGEAVVDCTLLDAAAGRITFGHRFHHPAPITIERPKDYAQLLEETGRVIPGFAARRAHIRQAVESNAASLGGRPDLDDALLDEVTALNEWPVPISASFEERFLEVPQEALVATMKGNQKYFPLFDAAGKLMNHFITIANIDSPQPELIQAGNERVIRPRLADAMFFWQQDGKRRLEDHLESLKQVVFQNKLGSMYDKSQRVAQLAEMIAIEIDGDPDLAHRAGLLSRCDLMTDMVFEFPEMQGIMGRYQARRDGEADELAEAMDEFYMPRFSGDRLPQSKTGIAISLAEKLDTLVGIFGIGQKPTGDRDPFALRRAALGALRIIREHSLSLYLPGLLHAIADSLSDRLTEADPAQAVYEFMMERLKGLYLDQGFSHDLFQAVLEVDPHTIADFDLRMRAMAEFRQLPEADSLAAANKRIRNILKKNEEALPKLADPTLFMDSAEIALFDRLGELEPLAQPLFDVGDYADGLRILAALKQPIDDYFDQVMVMAEDPALRINRLALLGQIEQLFLSVADISLLQQEVRA
ncbi:MAG: glycine--tRNA ligase subunit beta, partial [Candidatus Thiodiazotropha sp.]